MCTKIAINGLGRIGRNYLRLLLTQRSDLTLVAVNDTADTRTLARLLKDDEGHGPFPGWVRHDDKHLFLNGHAVRAFSERDPLRLPWAELGVDIVIEATATFVTAESARKHLTAGARKVIISAPSSEDDGTFVLGVNEAQYDNERHHVISNASCTTNCLAPVAKVFHDAFGIEAGVMTTIHADETDQDAQDVEDVPHSDLRPAAPMSTRIASASTGTAQALGRVLPELEGRLEGFALRVPVLRGSITHLTVTASRSVSVDEVKQAYRTAADGALKGILRCVEDEIATSDAVADPHSSILDAGLIRVIGDQVKISAWYDDEWGYSNRLADLTEYVAERL